jgi:Xaa-Pro dipeptidase
VDAAPSRLSNHVSRYQSDISRTFVMGEATKQQRDVWDLVRRGQQIAFDTAVNLVHGETAPLAPGMCFSDEPGSTFPQVSACASRIAFT